jgi:hypothetical protein
MARSRGDVEHDLMELTREIVRAANANDLEKLKALKRKQERLIRELQQAQ